MTHQTTVTQTTPGHYRATCVCGWRGAVWKANGAWESVQAVREGERHVEGVGW